MSLVRMKERRYTPNAFSVFVIYHGRASVELFGLSTPALHAMRQLPISACARARDTLRSLQTSSPMYAVDASQHAASGASDGIGKYPHLALSQCKNL